MSYLLLKELDPSAGEVAVAFLITAVLVVLALVFGDKS